MVLGECIPCGSTPSAPIALLHHEANPSCWSQKETRDAEAAPPKAGGKGLERKQRRLAEKRASKARRLMQQEQAKCRRELDKVLAAASQLGTVCPCQLNEQEQGNIRLAVDRAIAAASKLGWSAEVIQEPASDSEVDPSDPDDLFNSIFLCPCCMSQMNPQQRGEIRDTFRLNLLYREFPGQFRPRSLMVERPPLDLAKMD